MKKSKLSQEIDNITAQIFGMVLKIKDGSGEYPPSVFIPKVEKLIEKLVQETEEKTLEKVRKEILPFIVRPATKILIERKLDYISKLSKESEGK